jgi:hypothetical protein
MPSKLDKTPTLPLGRKVGVRMVRGTIRLETIAQWSHTLGPRIRVPERYPWTRVSGSRLGLPVTTLMPFSEKRLRARWPIPPAMMRFTPRSLSQRGKTPGS